MGSVIGGVTDAIGLSDSKGAKKAKAASEEAAHLARQQFERLNLPELEKMELALQSPELVGLLGVEELSPSSLENIQTDPRLAQAQMEALSYLSERGRAPINEEDRIAFDQFRTKAAGDESARQKSILQGMAERGNLDSGAQLAAQLSSSQNAAVNAKAEADRMALASIQAKKDAMSQMGNTAASMQNNQFNQQAQIGNAKDIINKFNTQARQDTQGKNLAARQAISERGTDIANQQQTYNKGLLQQQFNNQMSKANAIASGYNNEANQKASEANAIGSSNAASTGALITAAAMMMSDKTKKENIQPVKGKLKDFMDKLEAYEYNYKDDETKEPQTGVMAQDMEKSEIGKKLVKNTNQGKMIDVNKAVSTGMAAISDLNKRISNLENKK